MISTMSSSHDDDVFEVFFTSGPGSSRRPVRMDSGLGWRPPTDVYETETEFVVQMDLAGMAKSKIEVVVDDDRLVIRGTRANISMAGRKHFHEMEIRVGPFERHVKVPGHVDAQSAHARYESGFLFVTMAKGEGRRSDRRSIEIGS